MMKMRGLAIAAVLSGLSTNLHAQSESSPSTAAELVDELVRPRLAIEANVEAAGAGGAPTKVSGKVVLTTRGSASEDSGRCFHVAWNDPDYGNSLDASRRFERLTERVSRLNFTGGRTTISLSDDLQREWLRPHVFRVKASSAERPIELSFESWLPLLPQFSELDWFYEGFYPIPLARCPRPEESVTEFLPEFVDTQANIKIPNGYQYAGAGENDAPNSIRAYFTGKSLSFALSRKYERLAFNAAGVPVEFLYHSDDFPALRETVEHAMTFMTNALGEFPFPKLVVVETSELQRQGEAGLIAFNRPRQQVFKALQSDWLNWRQWVLTAFVAGQWLTSSVGTWTPDDDWLHQGLVDFLTFDTLRAFPTRYNLINARAPGEQPWFSFNYLQVQNITAASLRRFAPLAVLTDKEFRSKIRYPNQHPLLYVRQAVAARQLRSLAGEAPFNQFLRKYVSKYRYQRATPKDFRAFMAATPSPFSPTLRDDLLKCLDQWWTKRAWPDFKIGSLESELLPDGRWIARVQVSQLGTMRLPAVVGFTDEAGNQIISRSRTDKNNAIDEATLSFETVTAHRPTAATVDPEQHVFDVDRFDNTTQWPPIKFFPGNANTLDDDSYTVIWAPYAFRRPGESVSWAAQAAVVRYLHSTLFLAVETAPGDEKTAGSIRYRLPIPDLAMQSDTLISKDYAGSRLAEFALERTPVFPGSTQVTLGIKLRAREDEEEKNSRRQTAAIFTGVKPVSVWRPCSYKLTGESERAPPELTEGFSYTRSTGVVELACAPLPTFDLGLRVFHGKISGEGDYPETAKFRVNDLREARMRLDIRTLNRVENLVVAGTDAFLPFPLPLPENSLVLARQMRWRVFFDIARSHDEDLMYRSAGTGVLIPFGGDILGAGALAISRLSVLGIFYSRVGRTEYRKPSVVFDLTGEL